MWQAIFLHVQQIAEKEISIEIPTPNPKRNLTIVLSEIKYIFLLFSCILRWNTLLHLAEKISKALPFLVRTFQNCYLEPRTLK